MTIAFIFISFLFGGCGLVNYLDNNQSRAKLYLIFTVISIIITGISYEISKY